MPKVITDMQTWLMDLEEGTLFRYVIYKRVFTPYETQNAFSDESVFENTVYTLCLIEDAIDLGNGDWLLGMRNVDFSGEIFKTKDYVKLSEIRLSYFDVDQKIELVEPKEDNEDEL